MTAKLAAEPPGLSLALLWGSAVSFYEFELDLYWFLLQVNSYLVCGFFCLKMWRAKYKKVELGRGFFRPPLGLDMTRHPMHIFCVVLKKD
jgi:hypothetical protein